MRLSIERIRTLVLVAAALLIVAIGVFLGVARFRHRFLARDIPQRLGINIQQEANGVTYTQAHGGHTIFKLHASRVVQLRDNHATLHDVVIELYGKNDTSVDRIRGAEFDYNQQTTIATAAGEVEIEMQRPVAQQPAGANVSAPAKQEALPDDAIKVKTSGLTFNQSTGVVTTAQRVDFSTRQGSGTAVGARYDSDLGYLILDHDVVLNTIRGGDPVTVHATHLEFNRDTQVCFLRGVTAQSREEDATATDARMMLRSDGTVEQLDASSGFTLSTQQGSHISAPTGHMEFTANNQPRKSHMEGGVVIDSAAPGRTMHGTAPTMDLAFSDAGELQHAHLERGVDLQNTESQVQQQEQNSNSAAQITRDWRSPVVDIDFRSTTSGQVEPSTMHGTEGVVVSSETRRPGAAMVPARLAADDLTAQFGPHDTLQAMTGTGRASIDQTAVTGAHQTATGDRIEAQFVSAPQNSGKPASTGSVSTTQLSQVQTAQLDGHVVLFNQPAQRPGAPPQAPMRATAGHALYDSANQLAPSGKGEQWLHLTVNPRVTDGGMEMSADKVDVEQISGDAFAHGNVKATWTNGDGGGAQQPVTLGGTTPAHVIAADAELHQSTGEATFKGRARLWQDANSIAAPVIILNRQQQTLVALANGSGEPVQSALLSQGSPGTRPGLADGSNAHAPTVIRVRSGDLHYSGTDHKAVLRAAPLNNVIVQNGTVDTVSDQLEVYLTPVKNAAPTTSAVANATSSSQIDRLIARGNVVLTSQGRRGTGEELVYTAQSGTYVLTGTAATPPKMTDPQRGLVTGESLLFNSRDDSVSIEGGSQPSQTRTTAPR